MSKLESGEMTLEHKPFQMTALLDRVCRVIKVQAIEEGIDFNVDNEVLTHSGLIGSPAHIQQILMNLLNNAVKYNRRGGRVWLRCREIADRPDRSWFEFVCEDTGIGMSEAYQQHIFEPFSQESDGVKSKYDGTGLGLPITKRMIELMGGTIDFWSQKNVGTRFTVRFPLEIDIVSCHYDPAIHADETANLEGLRALLVEDNEMNMEIAEFLLKEQHMLVDRAWNGAQAVELFEQSETHAYDIVLMDIMMPVYKSWNRTEEVYEAVFDSYSMDLNTFKAQLQARLSEWNDNEEGYTYYIGSDARNYYQATDAAKLKGCESVTISVTCCDGVQLGQGTTQYKCKSCGGSLNDHSKKCAMTTSVTENNLDLSDLYKQEQEANAKITSLQSQMVNLSPIDVHEYCEFANRWLSKEGIGMEDADFIYLYDMLDGQTWYIQNILNRLYANGDLIDKTTIARTVDDVVNEQEESFITYCKSLTDNQLDLLIAIAKEDGVVSALSQEFLLKYSLPAASSVSLALKALQKKDFVHEFNGRIVVYDRFFGMWLKRG